MEDFKSELEDPIFLNHELPSFEEIPESNRNMQSNEISEETVYTCQNYNKVSPLKMLFKRQMENCTERSNITTNYNSNNDKAQEEIMTSLECKEITTSTSNILKVEGRHNSENIDNENLKNNRPLIKTNCFRRVEERTNNCNISISNSVTFSSLQSNPKRGFSEKCRYCTESFKSPLELLRHKRTHNSNKIVLPVDEIEKYFDYPNRSYCPICKQKLKTKNFRSVFTKHLLTHTSSMLYECVICKKQFTRKDHMRSHEKRHIVPLEELNIDKQFDLFFGHSMELKPQD